jgi:ADP-heptose:LPS heptosyltransferase
MKRRLLVLDLWGVGDLAVASPFLRLASQEYDVTLVAKPAAEDLRLRFWPEVQVIPFTAPWSAFRGKYRLHEWRWKAIRRLLETMRSQNFDAGVSARRDPRDHLLMALMGAKRRYGFPRLGSELLLTDPINLAEPLAHRYTHWQHLAKALGLNLPAPTDLPKRTKQEKIIVHTGAGQPVRVWPLVNYERLVARLRERSYKIQVLCDPDQLSFWQGRGEAAIAPANLTELCDLLESARVFVGNDSGPGHLAAVSGIPTFTIFGPQFPSLFAPIHPASEWVEGPPCPYKPCHDSCRFQVPHCLHNINEQDLSERIELFIAKQIRSESCV